MNVCFRASARSTANPIGNRDTPTNQIDSCIFFSSIVVCFLCGKQLKKHSQWISWTVYFIFHFSLTCFAAVFSNREENFRENTKINIVYRHLAKKKPEMIFLSITPSRRNTRYLFLFCINGHFYYVVHLLCSVCVLVYTLGFGLPANHFKLATLLKNLIRP